jgi:uncharacterized membrane protein YbhN (UPF0104 family)
MSTYWFRPKRYGYGATPVTWQGWALVGVAVAVIAAAAVLVGPHGRQNPWGWFEFLGIEALVLIVLWVITRRKTDGEWRWRWGDR